MACEDGEEEECQNSGNNDINLDMAWQALLGLGDGGTRATRRTRSLKTEAGAEPDQPLEDGPAEPPASKKSGGRAAVADGPLDSGENMGPHPSFPSLSSLSVHPIGRVRYYLAEISSMSKADAAKPWGAQGGGAGGGTLHKSVVKEQSLCVDTFRMLIISIQRFKAWMSVYSFQQRSEQCHGTMNGNKYWRGTAVPPALHAHLSCTI